MTRNGVLPSNATRETKRMQPVFDHLDAMTDERGLFEHALGAQPRPEHGYCVDDAARGLVVTCREPLPSPVVHRLRDHYLEFVLAALDANGTCRNRMQSDGTWRDTGALGDWWGRAVWGLGVAAAQSPSTGHRARALAGFRVAAQQRSPHSRSMAFAALGAAELLNARPAEIAARTLVTDALGLIDTTITNRVWAWPEPRLRYANASVAEALLMSGNALGDKAAVSRGLSMLAFLLRVETRDGHLSVTPVHGRGPEDAGPGFDQQPIEVAAIADACATAYRLTSDPRWLSGISQSWRWFLGINDSNTPMFDPITGAGYDGLKSDGRNTNRGAESTLAMLSTAQHARRVQDIR